MSEPIIQVRSLGKQYRLGTSARLDRTIPEMIEQTVRGGVRSVVRGLGGRPGRGRGRRKRGGGERSIWALRGVDLDVQQGEVIGIIGRNGAGKSTLLKILSQITDPSEGRAVIRGRVASLLEVGTGFHPELTGRENIFLNGAILGMTRREIASKFDQIVDFSGVERFLDTPLKRYSTGMAVRLAFAVAAHLEPEVLIIDEVLAVGDAAFQSKCIGKMKQVAGDQGRTVLFVSHNMDSIMHLSDRVMVLDGGRTSGCMPVEDAIHAYFESFTERGDVPLIELPRKVLGDRPATFAGLTVTGEGGQANLTACGRGMRVEVDMINVEHVTAGQCGVIITNEQGHRVVVFQSRFHSDLVLEKLGPTTRVTCEIPSLSLVPGTYHIDLNLVEQGRMVEYVERAGTFKVVFADVLGTGRLPNSQQGHFVIPCEWRVAA